MAHFAKLGKGNIVETVVVVHNNDAATESDGINFLKKLYNNPRDTWIKTSYNTKGGKYYNADGTEHSDQSLAFRKNFATIGGRYESNLYGEKCLNKIFKFQTKNYQNQFYNFNEILTKLLFKSFKKSRYNPER